MNRVMKLVILSLMGINLAYSYTGIEYMNTLCGGHVYVFNAKIIKLQPYMIESMVDDCEVMVIGFGSSISKTKVQLSFIDFDVPCDDGSMIIRKYSYNDEETEKCGRTKPTVTYKSVDDRLKITFKKNEDVSSPKSHFQILVTEIHTGVCNNLQFECNNYNCIDQYDLACDGYDNCGDNSDEVKGCILQPGAIAGIVIGSLVFLIFMSIIICRRARQGSVVHTNRQTSSQASTNQVIAQPYCIQPPTSYPISPPPYIEQPPPYNEQNPQCDIQLFPQPIILSPPPTYELVGPSPKY
ncbi:hypothetical protein SNE40_019429 [Patella caerulea]|uniref:CUB domain-containing protein n=1 Tax=Patella caerulea TaxID=87958 RepID=A0AAN8JAJ7_PATCE